MSTREAVAPVGDVGTSTAQATRAQALPLDAPRRRSYSRFSKRTFDVVVALFGLVLTLPLWPLLAWLVLRTEGALLHRQLRVGEGGRTFTIYKLRTMHRDAEPLGQALWSQTPDPRITFGGRLLRDTHLDELPQLWNVLLGDMSIVGPRPERPELSDALARDIPNWNLRLCVKPGLTGWAQVRLGYVSDSARSEEKLAHDLWYIEHRSVLLDAAICLRTLPSLLPR